MDIELQNINSDSKTGLKSEEAKQRLLKYGENKLKEKKKKIFSFVF